MRINRISIGIGGQNVRATLGPELRATGVTGLTGTATAATYDAGTGVAVVTRVDSANQSWIRFGNYTVGHVYRVDLSLTGSIRALVRGLATGATITAYEAGVRAAKDIIVPATGNFVIIAEGTGTLQFTVESIRRVL